MWNDFIGLSQLSQEHNSQDRWRQKVSPTKQIKYVCLESLLLERGTTQRKMINHLYSVQGDRPFFCNNIRLKWSTQNQALVWETNDETFCRSTNKEYKQKLDLCLKDCQKRTGVLDVGTASDWGSPESRTSNCESLYSHNFFFKLLWLYDYSLHIPSYLLRW